LKSPLDSFAAETNLHHLLKSQSHEDLVPLKLRMAVLIPCLLIVPLSAQDIPDAKPAPAAVQQAPADSPTAAPQVQANQQPPTQADPADSDETALQPPAQQVTQPPAQPPATPPAQPTTQPPGGVEATPPVPKPTIQLPVPRPPPPVTTERDTGGDNFSIEPFYWLTHSSPTVAQGHANTDFDPGALGFPGKSKFADGVFITVPTGHENSFEFRFFQQTGQGNSVLGTTEQFFTTQYAIGDVLATNYRLSSYKLSWNYLTYPYPSAGAKFRFKTLYEFQYAAIRGSFDAPADVNAVPTEGIKSIIRPTLGAGIEYHLARRVRFEAKLSGMGFPHHGDLYDGEASLVGGGPHFEFLLGARIFHLKTSPTSDQYYTETLWGPYAGLRLIWR
jgi:hypothetical protein